MTSYDYRLGSTLGVGQKLCSSAILRKKDARKPKILTIRALQNTALILGDEINFYKLDNTFDFAGKVQNINDIAGGKIQEIEIADYSVQLTQEKVDEVFENKKPDEVIEYLIDTYTDFTFVNSLTVTLASIDRIVRKDTWIMDIITEMLALFNGTYSLSKTKVFTLRQKQDVTNSNSLIFGTDAIIGNKWKTDNQMKAEKIVVKGATIDQRTTETLSGTGTVFYTTYIPDNIEIANLQQTTENIDGDYVVDKPNKKITFDTSKTDPVVSYTYQSPIKVELGSGKTVTLEKKYIEKKSEARKLAQEYYARFKDGAQNSKWIKVNNSADTYNIGESISVIDEENNKTGTYTIQEVEVNYNQNKTIITIGEEVDDLFNWQKEAMDRIKQLEQKEENSDFVTKYYFEENGVKVTVTTTITNLESYVNDGTLLWASETTLATDADLISDDNEEFFLILDNNTIDTSGNGFTGTWTGTATYSADNFIWNKSASFDGSSYITPAKTLDLSTIGDWSICLITKGDATVGTFDWMIGFGNSGTTNNYLGFSTDGSKNYRFASTDNVGSNVNISSTTLATSTSYHSLIVTYNDTTNTVEFFLDGVSVNTASLDMSNFTTFNTLVIGALERTSVGNHYIGLITDVKTYNKVLNSTEISTISSGKPIYAIAVDDSNVPDSLYIDYLA